MQEVELERTRERRYLPADGGGVETSTEQRKRLRLEVRDSILM